MKREQQCNSEVCYDMCRKLFLESLGLDWYTIDRADELPDTCGAYILVIFLPMMIEFSSAKTGIVLLDTGIYFYAGSANGPGGLKGRLNRHFKSNKKIHWHIDQLTNEGKVVGAFTRKYGNECDLVDLMLKTGQLNFIEKGIGSSDCKRCVSHLLMGSSEISLQQFESESGV